MLFFVVDVDRVVVDDDVYVVVDDDDVDFVDDGDVDVVVDLIWLFLYGLSL